MTKIKEVPVTRTELQDSIKYIDIALAGRVRALENKLMEVYSEPYKELQAVQMGIKVLVTLCLICIGLLATLIIMIK